MPNLDFLRAVAVLLVLANHLTYVLGYLRIGPFETLPMGSIGVSFFFVHTCFVLMLSLERQWKGQGAWPLFGSFLIRRIFRIYPLSIVVLLLVVAFHIPQTSMAPGHFFALPPNAATIVSNLFLIQGPDRSYVSVMWSLPFEMAMYLFLPWFFLFLRPVNSGWRVATIWLAGIVACIAVIRFGGGWPNHNSFLFCVPNFVPGVIAYQMGKKMRPHAPAIVWLAMVIAAAAFYIYQHNIIENNRIRSWLICLTLGLAIPFFAQVSAKWITAPAHLIAKYSYGIYLTHTFSIWLAFDRLHYTLPRLARFGLFAVLVVGLPLLFYHCLEEPMIRVGKRVAKRFEERAESRQLVAQ